MKLPPISRDQFHSDRALVHIYGWVGQHEPEPEWSEPCALVRLVYGSGLRVSEIAPLRVEDCTPEEGFIRVQCGKGGLRRDVRVIPEYEPFLRDRCALLREGLFFPRTDPRLDEQAPYSTRTLQRMWERVITEIHYATDGAVPFLSIHGGRHTFATQELAWGRMNPTVIQAQLGHSSVNITHAYYLHASLESLFKDRPTWRDAALAPVRAPNVVPMKRVG